MSQDSKGRKIGYWVTTGMIGAGMAGSGVMSLIGPPELAAAYERIGFPLHLMTLLGVAKLSAAVTLLAPGFARLKEWAYAGLTINLVGAVWAHAWAGDPIGEYGFIFVLLSLLFASYFLRPADRRLPDLARA